MNVLDMMRTDINSVIGKTVEYYYGGYEPLVEVVTNVNKRINTVTINDCKYDIPVYGISFNNGASYYTVDAFTKIIIHKVNKRV